MRDVFQQRLVLLANRVPIPTVHVRHVEPVAITSPHFVENLVPFFRRNTIDKQTRRRNRLSRTITGWCRVVEAPGRCGWPLGHEHFGTVIGQSVTADVFRERRLFSILEGIKLQRAGAIALPSVITRTANGVEQETSLS